MINIVISHVKCDVLHHNGAYASKRVVISALLSKATLPLPLPSSRARIRACRFNLTTTFEVCIAMELNTL